MTDLNAGHLQLHQPHPAVDNPAVVESPQSIHYMSSTQDIPPETIYNGKFFNTHLKSFALGEEKQHATAEPQLHITNPFMTMSPVQCTTNSIRQHSQSFSKMEQNILTQ